MVQPEHFYHSAHGTIYGAILALWRKDEAIDLLTLSDRLKADGRLEEVGGPPFLAELPGAVPSARNAAHYAKIVVEKAARRSLIRAALKMQQAAHDETVEVEEVIDRSEKMIYDVSRNRTTREFEPIGEIVHEVYEQAQKLAAKPESITGIATGFRDLDFLTSGLQPSELVILAARPSMGKTAFALNVAANVAIKGQKPVAIFSLEMSRTALVSRMLCTEARVNSQQFRTGQVRAADWGKVTHAAGILGSVPIYIDDSANATFAEIRAKSRKLDMQKKIGLIIVDYLQLMPSSGRGRNDSREQEVSENSRSLKGLARELDVPVLVLSQLSRAVEQRPDKRPMLSDLRESGAIEQDADVVMFLYREEYYRKDETDEAEKNVAEVIIAKQRNGPTGSRKVAWFADTTRFADLAGMDLG